MPASTTMMRGKSAQRIAARNLGLVFPIALYVVGAVVFFRWQIFSNFDLFSVSLLTQMTLRSFMSMSIAGCGVVLIFCHRRSFSM